MQHLNADEIASVLIARLMRDEIASVLIARLMREVQHFVAHSLIQEGTSADEVWSRFLKNLNNRNTSADN